MSLIDAQRREASALWFISTLRLVFAALGKPATSVQPGKGVVDEPWLGQHDKAANVRALDDFDIDLTVGLAQPVLELRSLIAAVGIELEQG